MNRESRRSKAAVAAAMQNLTEALGPAGDHLVDRTTPMIEALVEFLRPYEPITGELIVVALYLLAEVQASAEEQGL